MSLWAIVVNDVVHEVIKSDQKPEFFDSVEMYDVSAYPNIEQRWVLNEDGTFSPPQEVEITEEERALYVRTERDRLLSETDWAMTADSPHNTEELRVYRQALRDIPQQEGFPNSVVWPEKPKEATR